MIKGYKSFRKELINQIDEQLEEGKTYRLERDITWNKCGYHFCSSPEDTLRYMREYDEETIVAEVHSNGKVHTYDDEYNGYYNMFVSDEITIDRVLSREELFNLIINHGENSILKMIQNYILTQAEINSLSNRSIRINQALLYYQLGDNTVYRRLLH
jgi:hypothetical protein